MPTSLETLATSLDSDHSDTNKGIIKVPHWIPILAGLKLRKAIAHKLEPICSLVCQIVVLPPHSLEHLEEVESRSWIYCRDRAHFLTILEPRAATCVGLYQLHVDKNLHCE